MKNMIGYKITLFVIIFILGTGFSWGVIAFISQDALWFWNTVIGRIIAVIIVSLMIRSALKATDNDQSMPD